MSFSCECESNVEILRKCFFSWFIKGIGNLLYIMFLLVMIINLKSKKKKIIIYEIKICMKRICKSVVV